MLRKGTIKKLSKKTLSLILILAVMFSLAVPCSTTTLFSAEETSSSAGEPATGNDICAILYDVRSSDEGSHWMKYELVIQKGSTHDPDSAVPRRKFEKQPFLKNSAKRHAAQKSNKQQDIQHQKIQASASSSLKM